MKLILWDIDGTLMNADFAGERAVARTLKLVFGIDGKQTAIHYFGKTDVLIAHLLLEHYQIPRTADNLDQYFKTYLEELPKEIFKGSPYAHPGIREVVHEIHQHPNLLQGLLTGNLMQAAKIKLQYLNLWSYFRFGAFAEDSLDRNDLGPYALERACAIHGQSFSPENVYVVGDTPLDIACARAIGAKSIAIATGGYNVEELRAQKPTALLQDLAQPQRFFELIDLI